ncbi:glycosyltransferase family 1 protein [Paenibacillus roseipurpureus]|uniref:Glycosyltransferase family 1 protein n=1 Tax=Paenibacillus roseopurpureus TaxID=2918901 RepID=A0AA96LQ67_9BACL|nr:glycosyltransferase family 1 protein [Paenibacillus sp. MBLB1832]WNR43798.1 glycosyltransferase family 1 protein [Paenibacillus sp. MBLB1832]
MKCRLNIAKRKGDGHISQILAGFIMLHEQKLIELDIHQSDEFPFVSIVEATINNDIKVLYDMADGYTFDQERVEAYAARADYYFKRSFNQELHHQYPFASRIHPLGLNYHVTVKNNILDKPLDGSILEKTKWYLKEKIGKNYHQKFYVEHFEDQPKEQTGEPRILFATRTWSEEVDDLSMEETKVIDDRRAQCIRELRNHFGPRFIGGFSQREYARKHYSDCLLDDSKTNRTHFMKLVKESDICLATMGLFGSNGWKLGEYVAASKGIVSERLRYQVPGFKSNDHYLEFTDVEECVKQTIELASNPALLLQMKRNNYNYYHAFLRPDQLILNSFATMQVI